MSANRTQNSHMHRLRRRLRISEPTNHMRKFRNYLAVQVANLNAIVGVAGVTETELETAHRTPQALRDEPVHTRFVRGATTPAQVTALGIPIA
jgi:hypothetical protein